MKHLRVRKPSPAMVVAIAALSVSLVGTAFAGPIAEISALNKKDKQQIRKIARKIAHRLITKRAPGLSVANAQSANTVPDGAITSEKLANDAVSTDKIANDAVSTDKIADDAVDTAKLSNDAVNTAKLANDAVSTAKLANGAVTQAKVGTNAIGAAQLKNLVARSGSKAIANGGSDFANVFCQAGEQVLGVATLWNAFENGLYTNYVRITGNGVEGRGNNFSGNARTFSVQANCLPG